MAAFVVVKGDIPIVVGRNHLQALGLLDVFVAMNNEEILWAVEHDVVKERETPNVVSGVNESKSDEELVAAARKVVRAQADHLDEETFERLWECISRYKECWLRPRSSQVKSKTQFQVSGRPFKSKLRPMLPEMRDELDAQLQAQLENGVVRVRHGGYR